METAVLLAVASVAIVAPIAAAVIVARRRREHQVEVPSALSAGETADPVPDGDRHPARAPIQIVPLEREEGMRFALAWRMLQMRFVEDPGGAVAETDRLLGEVMIARGYPLGEIDDYVIEISALRPRLVSDYRAARKVALQLGRGDVPPSDLRSAFVHYHALFHDLLRVDDPGRLARRREPGGRQAV